MTEEVFTKLIEKFNIDTEFDYEENFSRTGCYHSDHGGYSIIYNCKILDSNKANKILNQYLNNLV